MNREQYMTFHQECCNKMVDITRAKNEDYAGGADDPFFNFTRVEKLGVCETERGFLTRMTDKFARIITFVNVGILKVKDESVEDTLLDLANYCILLAGYLRSKRQAAVKDKYMDGGDHAFTPVTFPIAHRNGA